MVARSLSPLDDARAGLDGAGVKSRTSLIFVNRFFYPDHSATSQMLTDLAFALSERGHATTVITSRLNYESGVPALPGEETIRGVRIIRVATSGFGRANLIGRTADYLTFYLAAAWALVRNVRAGDTVVAKTDPPMMSVVVGPLAALRGARLVHWLQDIFPETATSLGLGRGFAGRIAFGVMRRLRNASLRSGSMVVVIGERMAATVQGFGVPPERIRIIHNWADGAAVRPVADVENSLRESWDLADCFVVGYSGNLGRAHDVATLLAAVERLEALEPDGPAGKRIVWLFVGGGAQTALLQDEARKRGLTSLRFKAYQPRERLSESLSVADIHLVSLRPELEGLIVPSKYYGIAAAGRPAIFIGDHDGEVARIMRRAKAGFVIAQGDSSTLADVVLAAAADREMTRAMGRAARAAFDAEFDLPRAVTAWEQIIGAGQHIDQKSQPRRRTA